MKILLIEPYYSGSHKHFADQLKKYSRHSIELLTLEGRFWKWRMYGAGITLAHRFIELACQPDMILVTDMLDLTSFLSLTRKHVSPTTPIVCYFHENQMAYPWHDDSKDLTYERDLHYGMMNYQTALVSDWNLFNSAYNMTSLFDELTGVLKKMPDYKHDDCLTALKKKSSIMPLGLALKDKVREHPKPLTDLTSHPSPEAAPLILWNHRWEHDKNPQDFFDVLSVLKNRKIPFRLAVLGQQYKRMPKIFKEVPERFSDELIWYGFGSYEDYLTLLNHADILPVTSNHDFFGISVMEAIHCGARPLLPKRLSYPELYNTVKNPNLFYSSKDDLIDKLVSLCTEYSSGSRDQYTYLTAGYDWSEIINKYDDFFDGMGS